MADGATQGPGNPPKWERDISGANLASPFSYFEVRNDRFEAKGVNGKAVWKSKSISIPNGDSITLSSILGSSGSLGPQDVITAYYEVDNNGKVQWAQRTGSFQNDTITSPKLSGDSVEVSFMVEQGAGNPNKGIQWLDEVKGILPTYGPICLDLPPLQSNLTYDMCCSGAGCQTWDIPVVCVNERVEIQFKLAPNSNVDPTTIWTDGPVYDVQDPAGNTISPIICPPLSTPDRYCFKDPVINSQQEIEWKYSSPGIYNIYVREHFSSSCPSSSLVCALPEANHTKIKVVAPLDQNDIYAPKNDICVGQPFELGYYGPGSPDVNINYNTNNICSFQGQAGGVYDFYGCSQPGVYTFTVTAENECGVVEKDITIRVHPNPDVNATADPDQICEGEVSQLYADVSNSNNPLMGSLSYSWLPTSGLNNATIQDPQASPSSTTTYTALVTSQYGCIGEDDVTVEVSPSPSLTVNPIPDNKVCATGGCKSTQPTNCVPVGIFTDPNATVSISPQPSSLNQYGPGFYLAELCPSTTTTYTITSTNNGCTTTEEITIVVENCECKDHQANPTNIWNNESASNVGSSIGPVDVTIKGIFRVDQDFTFNGTDVKMAKGAKILVKSNAILTITNESHIFSCTEMWEGIDVEGQAFKFGGELIVNGRSVIEDAKEAVHLLNGADESHLTITNSCLNKNWKHVVIEPYSSPHSATISGSNFTCEPMFSNGNTLRPPHNGQHTRTGVEINSVEEVTIGDANLGMNLFERTDIGIDGYNSSLIAENNRFRSIDQPKVPKGPPPPPPHFGRAIWLQGNGDQFTKIGGFANNEMNDFVDCYRPIEVNNYRQVEVFRNEIDLTEAGGVFSNRLGGTAIYAERRLGNDFFVDIADNTIHDHELGIHVMTEHPEIFPEIHIDGNTIKNPNFNKNRGIILESAVPGIHSTTVWTISNNTIEHSGEGIHVRNMEPKVLHISTNDIDVVDAFGHLFNNTGIRVENSHNLHLLSNDLDGPGIGSKYRGILAQLSEKLTFRCNTISDFGDGLRFESTIVPQSTILSNNFDGFINGIYFDGNTVAGDQGSPGNPGNPQGNEFLSEPSGGGYDAIKVGNFPSTNFYRLPDPCPTCIDPTETNLFVSTPTTTGFQPICPINTFQSSPTSSSIEQVAEDSINYSSPEGRWLAMEEAYSMIKTDSTLPGNDQTLIQFEDSIDQSNMGTIREIRMAVQNGNIGKAISLNNGMSPTCPIEAEHKTFNNIYLNTMAVGGTCTASQRAQIRDIAEKCPLEYGNAVHKARSMYRASVDSVVHFDGDCSQDTTRSDSPLNKSRTTSVEEEERRVVSTAFEPNPAREMSRFTYSGIPEEGARVEIRDLHGRTVKSFRIQGSKGVEMIDLSDLSNGAYLYKVWANGKVIQSDKLMKSK